MSRVMPSVGVGLLVREGQKEIHMDSVFELAAQWAEQNFNDLEGQDYDADFLAKECQRLL